MWCFKLLTRSVSKYYKPFSLLKFVTPTKRKYNLYLLKNFVNIKRKIILGSSVVSIAGAVVFAQSTEEEKKKGEENKKKKKAALEKKTGTKTLKSTIANINGVPPYRILSIDGGGIKGIFPAYVLAEIEHRLKQGLPKDSKFHIGDYFHLLAGTSTGGLIALGLANFIPAKKLVLLYTSKGDQIFKKKNRFAVGFCASVLIIAAVMCLEMLSFFKYSLLQCSFVFNTNGAYDNLSKSFLDGIILDLALLKYLTVDYIHEKFLGNKYQREALDNLLKKEFQKPDETDLTFGELSKELNGEKKPHVLITAYNLTKNQPFIFNSNENSQADLKVWEIAGATSAAPTYFSPKKITFKENMIDVENYFIDGAFFSNDPGLIAFSVARDVIKKKTHFSFFIRNRYIHCQAHTSWKFRKRSKGSSRNDYKPRTTI